MKLGSGGKLMFFSEHFIVSFPFRNVIRCCELESQSRLIYLTILLYSFSLGGGTGY